MENASQTNSPRDIYFACCHNFTRKSVELGNPNTSAKVKLGVFYLFYTGSRNSQGARLKFLIQLVLAKNE